MQDQVVLVAQLVVLAGGDPRHAVVAEQQLSALAALVLAGGDVTTGGRGAGEGESHG